jgi:RimJ/RimL family protein N-acetyltransferase
MNIEKTTLSGTKVRLEPLSEAHLPGLANAIRDGELWKLAVTSVPHPEHLQRFLEDADLQFHAGKELAFATVDQATGTVVGSTRFRNIEAPHRRVEIGFTFIAQSWQRSHINTQAKYLMLQHAFEHWQCNRVELLTDCLNLKSRAAIARIGAREEGVLRSHMVMRDGRIRDSVIFSLIAAEWPAARARLANRLEHTDYP